MNSSIGGEQNPTIGKKYNYYITDMLDVNLTITNELSTYIWHIYVKLKNGKIVDITKDGGKIGSEVPYSFSEKAINKEYILVVNRATKKLLSTDYKFEKIAEFHIFPTKSTETKIEKVILFNKDAKDVNKASYTDTLVARAYCIGMVDKEIEFQLWEDDAKGKGHDTTINKKNTDSKFIFKATVNRKGIAEVKIPLSSDPKLLQNIANKYLMPGDKTEGANHEYYVTASYLGEVKGASQVNVDVKNPDNNKTQNAPKKESAIFPVDKGVAKPDINKKIINAYFADKNDKRITKVVVGTQLYVVIHTNSMVDKYIQYVIWEIDDSGMHDPIHRSDRLKVIGNLMSIKSIVVTKDIFKVGIDFNERIDPDAKKQNYYIEVIAPDLEAKSRHFGITLETGLLEVENTKSVIVVNKQEKKKEENTTCVCKQYDLIWGNKVSCEFRKKVIEISKELWANDYMNMANNLMAIMALETERNFNPKYQNNNGYFGLIGFGNSTVDDFYRVLDKKITKEKIINCTAVEQLYYVKERFKFVQKYLMNDQNGGILSDFTDLYLAVLYPTKSGLLKGEDAKYKIIFDASKGKKAELEYRQNPSFMKEEKEWETKQDVTFTRKGKEVIEKLRGYKDLNKAKTFRWEITEEIISYKNEGDKYKEGIFSCQDVKKMISKKNVDSKWHDPINNPISTNFYQNGNFDSISKIWGLFGDSIRKEVDRKHTGLDLFALTGTDVFACVDGTVYNRRWHTGYGNTITIKIKDPKAFMARIIKDYKHKTVREMDKGLYWKDSGDIYLFYAHLDSINEYNYGDEVMSGDTIGTTGRSGVKTGTCAPHLHFEIFSKYEMQVGTNHRINPAYFVRYKEYDKQSEEDKKKQEKEKDRGQIKEFKGKLNLSTNNLF